MTQLVYLLLFLSTILICYIFEYRNLKFVKYNRIITLLEIIMISLPIILILGGRLGVGTDYFNYKRYYLYFLDYGYVSVVEISNNILFGITEILYDKDFSGFIILSSTLIVFLFVIFLVNNIEKKKLPLAMLMTLSLYWGIWCNNIRQAIGMGFIMLCYSFMRKSMHKNFLFNLLLAISFHTSAIVYFLYYMIINLNNKKRIISLLIVVLVLIIYAFDNQNIPYQSYLFSKERNGNLWYFLFLNIFIYIPEILCIYNVKTYKHDCLKDYTLILCELMFYTVSLKINYAFRAGYYFSFGHIVLMPAILDSSKNRFLKNFIYLYYLCFYISYFLFTTYYLRLNGVNNYDCFFW